MDMEEMSREFPILKKAFYELKETLNIIREAIVGNALARDGGMVQRMINAEGRVKEFEKRLGDAEKNQIKYTLQTRIMWASLGAVGMAVIALVLQYLFKR